MVRTADLTKRSSPPDSFGQHLDRHYRAAVLQLVEGAERGDDHAIIGAEAGDDLDPTLVAQAGLAEALIEAGYQPDGTGLFCCEGVAVYLEDAVLESVLGELRTLAPAGSQLAVSAATSPSSVYHIARRRRFQRAVAAMGEPVRTSLTGEQMAQLLGHTGWRLKPVSDLAHQAGLLLAEP